MIELTKMTHTKFILNAEIIECVEEVPETLITLTNGKKYIVLESVEQVINRVLQYKRKIFSGNL